MRHRLKTSHWIFLTILWVAFIWGHSLVQGPESSLESGRVVALMRPIFEACGVTDVDVMGFVVRKLAHFSEYAVLGVLVQCLEGSRAGASRLQQIALWLVLVLVPVLDETLQLFVPGRAGSPRDVCIDLAGACLGALVARHFMHVRNVSS